MDEERTDEEEKEEIRLASNHLWAHVIPVREKKNVQ
jgi:hypothetical protein